MTSGIGIAYGADMSRHEPPSSWRTASPRNSATNQVLTRVTLPVMERDVVCVVGPSGSGKTTLLRCLALLEDAERGPHRDAGHAHFDAVAGQAGQGGRPRGALRDRHGVPALQSLAAHVGAGEPDRGADPGEEDAQGPGRRHRRDAAGQGRSVRQARRLSGAAVGRPAAARGDCPRAGHVAQGPAVRRGNQRARSRAAPRGAARHAPARAARA